MKANPITEKQIEEITAYVARNFPTFGGSNTNLDNPIAFAMINKPAVFALGVDVKSVVRCIVNVQCVANAINRPRKRGKAK